MYARLPYNSALKVIIRDKLRTIFAQCMHFLNHSSHVVVTIAFLSRYFRTIFFNCLHRLPTEIKGY